MQSILGKLTALKTEVQEHIANNPELIKKVSATHAGQVITGLGHAIDNATWFIEAQEKLDKEAAEKAAKETPTVKVLKKNADSPKAE